MTAQEAAKTAPRWPQKTDSLPSCFGIGRQELSKTPLDPSKIDFWLFFLIFWWMFGLFLVDFALLFA